MPVMAVWIIGYLIAINLTCFAVFAWDKRRAKIGGRRVSERNLLFLCLIGGSVGGAIARHILRHKTVKQPFRTQFISIVFLQIAALVLFTIL